MVKYIVLAVLLALGVLLYVKREEVMSFFKGEPSATEQLQDAMQDIKTKARDMKDALMGDDQDDIEIDEVEVTQ